MTISVKTIVLFAVFFTGLVGVNIAAPAKPPAEKPSPQDALEKRRLDLEETKLALERERLTNEVGKNIRDFELEKQKLRWTSVSISLSIFVPLLLGVFAYVVQVWLQRTNAALQLKLKADSEILQFKLKATDIIMSARDTTQVKAKAVLLTTLFPNDLCELELNLAHLDPKTSLFSESIAMREKLLTLLAEHPESRREIIHAWEIVFPWDARPAADGSYRWFLKLKENDLLNKNHPAEKVESKPPTEMKSDGNEDG